MRCSWLIDGSDLTSLSANKAARPGISLTLSSFATECGWDHVYIYDGDGMYGKQIAALSGVMTPLTELSNREFVAESGKAFLYFYSDLAYNMSGFNISYRMEGCPSNCHSDTNQGKCNLLNRECSCSEGWTGRDCSQRRCQCQNGKCDQTTGTCNCFQLFHGPECSQSVDQPAWYSESRGDWESVGGRASHATVVLRDELWVTGGLNFHGQTMSFMAKYNFPHGNWSLIDPVVTAESDGGPLLDSSRYDHSVVEYKNRLYLFGGVVDRKNISSDLWEFNPESRQWKLKTADTGHTGALPYHVAGHTAHVVDGVMIVVFGYNPYRGYINTVQEYNFQNNSWSSSLTSKSSGGGGDNCWIKGSYGHSSVYDPDTKRIYVFGGYYGRVNSAGEVLDQLLIYDPAARKWSRGRSSGYQLFRHAAGLMDGGVMIVVGGNAHNSTLPEKTTKCYADVTLAYDIECDSWYTMPAPVNLTTPGIGRYGHTVETYKNDLYVYGGFNGRMLNNVLKFEPGSCSYYKDQQSCIDSELGVKCVWNTRGSRGTCMQPSQAANEAKLPSRKGSQNGDKAASTLSTTTAKNFAKGCANRGRSIDGGSPGNCDQAEDCQTCLSADTQRDCRWCNGGCTTESECRNNEQRNMNGTFQMISKQDECPATGGKKCCGMHQTCTACSTDKQCFWQSSGGGGKAATATASAAGGGGGGATVATSSSQGTCVTVDSIVKGLLSLSTASRVNECPAACSQHTKCSACSEIHSCMWCFNLERCVAINAYSASFPYGQCTNWSSHTGSCKSPSDCRSQQTCSDCQALGPRCGWCDDGSGTGLGKCLPGGLSGPTNQTSVSRFSASSSSAEAVNQLLLSSGTTVAGGSNETTEGEEFNNMTDVTSTTPLSAVAGITTSTTTTTTTEYAVVDNVVEDDGTCPSDQWYFFDCPACQCNGHGHCDGKENETEVATTNNNDQDDGNRSQLHHQPIIPQSSLYKKPNSAAAPAAAVSADGENQLECDRCQGHTTGKHCDTCNQGYYGNALNGGNCTKCECNGKATNCDPLSGDCFCTTKGVSGKHCDKCDQKYVGTPGKGKNDTCYYELSVDFIFTFKLDASDPKDKYVNQINFVTVPQKQGTDVKFKLTCSGSTARVNLSVTSGSFQMDPRLGRRERKFLSGATCNEIERKFSHDEFQFGTDANTTFYVYLYDFNTPVIIQISFAQTPPIDWIRFFITFACCFITLLFVAAVLWKVKLSVDLYRRRQRLYVEMAHMASRPFGNVQLELSTPTTAAASKGKKGAQPIAVEPTGDYRSAVVTVAMRLPTGGRKYAPSGQSGLAVGSTLVHLSPAHQALLTSPDTAEPQNGNGRWGKFPKRLTRLPRAPNLIRGPFFPATWMMSNNVEYTTNNRNSNNSNHSSNTNNNNTNSNGAVVPETDSSSISPTPPHHPST